MTTCVAAALLTSWSARPPHAVARQDILGYKDLGTAVLRGNPALEAARLGAESAALEPARASTLPDPTVAFAYQPLPVYTARGSQRSQVRVEQPLPYPGKLHLRSEHAVLSSRIERAAVENLELDLLLQAQRAWIEIRHVDRLRTHIAAYEEKLADFEAVAAELYRVGTGSQQAILRMQLERTSLARTRLDLDTRYKAATGTLREVLGGTYRFSLTDGPEVSTDLRAGIADTLVAAALLRRPDAQAVLLMSRRAEVGADLARRDFLPDFAVSLTWFDMASEPMPASADGRDALAVGLAVRVPLWRGGRRAAVEQRSLERQQAGALFEALALQIESRVEALLAALSHDDEQDLLYREALLPQAQATSEAALSAYSTGRGDFLMLLDAERALYSLNTGLEEVRTRRAHTLAELSRVTGQH